MSEATAFQNAIPDGWYDDPAAPNMQRWWSGTEWTDHVRYSDRPRPHVSAAPSALPVQAPVAYSPAPLAPVTAEWPAVAAQTSFSPMVFGTAPATFATPQSEKGELASAFNDLYVPMRHWQIGSVSSAQLVRQRRSAKVVALWVIAIAAVGVAAGVAVWVLFPR